LKVNTVCYHLLSRLRKIRRLIGQDVTARFVLALIASRLDYCNAEFAAVYHSVQSRSCMQRVQHSAARLLFEQSPRRQVPPMPSQLPWYQYGPVLLVSFVH
jgi:hypothetical protein